MIPNVLYPLLQAAWIAHMQRVNLEGLTMSRKVDSLLFYL